MLKNKTFRLQRNKFTEQHTMLYYEINCVIKQRQNWLGEYIFGDKCMIMEHW